ncbi:hypothetical protein [Qipengyuania sp. DGS5-3]|uniref:hypothetical protein n=1 Tax=Qipengyuania sp. DGS5-3 TaxID=3349632 RepID=UPI0036D302B5
MSKTLLAAVEDLENIEKELVEVTLHSETIDRRRLIKLRASLLQGLMSLGQTAKDDAEFSADPERLKRFRHRHNEIKNHMSQHQANWMPSTIREDPEEYNKAARNLGRANAEFFAWAKKVAT